jgi:hypothetical protein
MLKGNFLISGKFDLTGEDLEDRCMLAPIHSGLRISGQKRRAIGIASVCVAVWQAAGFDIEDEALIGNSDDDFVDKVIQLYKLETLRHSIASREEPHRATLLFERNEEETGEHLQSWRSTNQYRIVVRAK